MRIMMIANYAKGDAKACVRELIKYLRVRDCRVTLFEYDYDGRYPEDAFVKCDLVLVIGGDGTIIHSAKAAAKHKKPILGVNVGLLGFTAGMESNDLFLLQQLLNGDFINERRMMIEAQIISHKGEKKLLALNDVVVSGDISKIVNYNLSMEGNQIYSYRADGFIISTPTGSTAYALSAGGPVIEPSMDCIEYTPICPHSLFNRSVIFNADTILYAWISEKNLSKVYLSADGGIREQLHIGDKIVFHKSSYYADFIRFNNKNFYDTLYKKIISTN